ncbi:hypothetical protein GGX14DRAFT_581118 [Mycena pura]|uniref:DUF6532 domain-containing protein n=1 Tax=Mycena pura TaxID=153505 RepID=A0AAD6Y0J8_9AGAR|nr:hypothetical protein GGX14DRAFT_581118 [Mycena pura]
MAPAQSKSTPANQRADTQAQPVRSSTGARHNNLKENVVAPRRKAPAKIIEDSDDEYESEERDSPVDAQASNHEHEGNEDDPQPTRSKRTRQMSEREAQRHAEATEAAKRKAAKAAKATEKQHRVETGQRPAPIPVQDTVFTSREAGTNQPKKKLVERSSRVPGTPARRPLVAANGSHPVPITGTSISDWRKYAEHQIPEDYDDHTEPRLHDINGQRFPNRVRLDLHTISPRDIAQLPEAGPSSASSRSQPHERSISPEADYLSAPSRGRPRERSISPRPRRRMQSVSPVAERTPSPIAGDKRARAPEDDAPIHTAQAQKINDHQGPARAQDYDETTQELLRIANVWIRGYLATQDPFPDHATEVKMIAKRGPQMRGELKTKVRALVELVFGFDSGQNRKNVRKNRELAEDLKVEYGYTYLVFHRDIAERKGIYRAKIIQKAANVMWFSNRRDEGVILHELFGPVLPKPTFALILTAIECCIDEWLTGIKTDTAFTAADYAAAYRKALESLERFEKKTAPRNILENILTRVHNIGRFHSGAQPIASDIPAVPSLSLAAIEAAIKEFDEDSVTESDGENGERSD